MAEIKIDASRPLKEIIVAAGGDPDKASYDNGRLIVPDVDDATLTAAALTVGDAAVKLAAIDAAADAYIARSDIKIIAAATGTALADFRQAYINELNK